MWVADFLIRLEISFSWNFFSFLFSVADYVRYIYAITQDPPKDEKMLRAAAYSISHLEKFIKNIDKFPVFL